MRAESFPVYLLRYRPCLRFACDRYDSSFVTTTFCLIDFPITKARHGKTNFGPGTFHMCIRQVWLTCRYLGIHLCEKRRICSQLNDLLYCEASQLLQCCFHICGTVFCRNLPTTDLLRSLFWQRLSDYMWLSRRLEMDMSLILLWA